MTAFLVYLAVGAAAGVLAGLFGVGGGLVIVPVLVWVFTAQDMDASVVMHLAIGTSLATIALTSLASIRAHHRRGAVVWPWVVRLLPGIVLGALAGAWLADQLHTGTLKRFFGAFELLVAAQLLFVSRYEAHFELPGRAGMGVAGAVIGVVSALIGIGGGTLTVPFLVWCRAAVIQAVATAAACGFPIAVAGALGFVAAGWREPGLPPLASGYLYWPAWAGIVLASTSAAGFGAWLAHRLPAQQLRRLFALLLAALGLNMLLA